VLGALTGVMGSIQAIEVIKQILEIGESLESRLLLFDALSMEFRVVKLRRDPKCPLCGDDPTISELIDYEGFCGAPFPGQDHAPGENGA
jgi:adenylyltransferase/sulfurtransferase